MAKISRTEKYKDLRDSLARDVGQEIESRELDQFQKRLNQLDSTNFEAPRVTPAADHDPIHARRTHLSRSQNVENTENLNFNLDNDDQYQNLYQTESFHNDYLDRYINEVKKYNIEQGNAVSEYTSVNVLDGLRKDNKEKTSRPVRPYPEERRESRQPVMPQQEEASVPRNPKDIAAEVQNLADEASDYFEEEIEEKPVKEAKVSRMDTDEFNKHLELERTTRQQLLNETTQMRAKLDDYEDNLSEVSDKMRHTSQILNIVLIILIIALVIVLAVVIYWIFLANGGN